MPENCFCNYERNTSSAITTLAVSASIAIAMFFALVAIYSGLDKAFGADAVSACLSKEQARAKWPKDVVYWHTASRCWDNIVPERRYAKPDRTRKAGKMTEDPNGNAVGPLAGVRWYPRTFAPAERIPFADPDRDTALDECCWPKLPIFIPWDERVAKFW